MLNAKLSTLILPDNTWFVAGSPFVIQNVSLWAGYPRGGSFCWVFPLYKVYSCSSIPGVESFSLKLRQHQACRGSVISGRCDGGQLFSSLKEAPPQGHAHACPLYSLKNERAAWSSTCHTGTPHLLLQILLLGLAVSPHVLPYVVGKSPSPSCLPKISHRNNLECGEFFILLLESLL